MPTHFALLAQACTCNSISATSERTQRSTSRRTDSRAQAASRFENSGIEETLALRIAVPADGTDSPVGVAQRLHASASRERAAYLPGHLTALRPSPDASNRHCPTGLAVEACRPATAKETAQRGAERADIAATRETAIGAGDDAKHAGDQRGPVVVSSCALAPAYPVAISSLKPRTFAPGASASGAFLRRLVAGPGHRADRAADSPVMGGAARRVQHQA